MHGIDDSHVVRYNSPDITPGLSPVLVAHAYNPVYSVGRDQEDLCQPGQIVHETLSKKNPSHKRTGGVAQGVGLTFKPQY
jgi:hypothetical protein